MELKAKCPHCFGEKQECDKCGGSGFVTATMPEGDWYTRHCTHPLCGFDNGGCQGRAIGDLSSDKCIMCDHPEVVWIPMCEASHDPPWRTHQKDNDFAKYLLAIEEHYKNQSLDEPQEQSTNE